MWGKGITGNHSYTQIWCREEGHEASQEQEKGLAKEIKMDMAGKHIRGCLLYDVY